jgi:FkbM family methyltransferase
MQLTLQDYESLNPRAEIDHNGVKMTFATPNQLTLWRVQSIYDKEPWTLEWIASFKPDEILLDCGANVGMYTIWAAATRGVRVFAFEPEAQNYALLNRNIVLNGLASSVRAFCMGLSDKAGISELHMTDLRLGGSCHALGEPLDFKHEPMHSVFVQGSLAGTVDELVGSGSMPAPNHIKIDVDGFEPRVIEGSLATLRDRSVRSLLIETNQNLGDHRAMVGLLEKLGFSYDRRQVDRAERREGTFKGVAEYVFTR